MSKTLLSIVCVLLCALCAGTAFGQMSMIGVYHDPGYWNYCFADPPHGGPGEVHIYVVHKFTPGATASQWMISTGGMLCTYISETSPFTPYSEMRGITPAAGFTSTVSDLARLACWQFRLLDDGTTEVLKPYTLCEMQSVQWLHPSWEWGWGLGFELFRTPDRDLVGHGGLVGGHRSAFYLSPREKVAVIALANAVDGAVFPGQQYSIVDKAFEWIAPAIEKATSKPVQAVEPDPAWKQYEGTYRAWWTDLTVLVMKGSLVLIYSRAEDPMQYMLTLVPEKAGAFRVEGDGFDETGELVTFDSDGSGAIVGMRLGNDNYERVDLRKKD